MRILLLPMLLLSGLSLFAQQYKKERIDYVDATGQRTKEKTAEFMIQHVQVTDSLYELNLYNPNGPRIVSIQFSDAAEQTRNGRFITYNSGGTIDTLGQYDHGLRDGIWDCYKGKKTSTLKYSEGQLLWKKDTTQYKAWSDSLKLARNDTATHKVEVESAFPGGSRGWLTFLNTHLRYPDEAVKKMQMGMVTMGFIVGKDGKVDKESLYLDRSVCYSLDKEGLRIISISPDWTPAIADGKPLKSYKKQPIVFKLEVQK